MIQAIGFIVAAYALTRLFQVPWENYPVKDDADATRRLTVLMASSAIGCAVIAYFVYSLLTNPVLPPGK